MYITYNQKKTKLFNFENDHFIIKKLLEGGRIFFEHVDTLFTEDDLGKIMSIIPQG